jgi:hypothetical protein
MLNIFFWLIFGILGGWTVALIAQPEAVPKRATGSGIVGAIGGIFGGGFTQYATHRPIVGVFNGPSILFAVIVGVIFAVIFNLILSQRNA